MAENLGALFLDGEAFPFTDISTNTQVVTNNGDVVKNDSIKKFGTSSMYFDGSCRLQVDSSEDFGYVEDEEFTADFWVKGTDFSGEQKFIEMGLNLNRWIIMVKSDLLQLRRGTGVDSSAAILNSVPISSLSTTEWNHVAVTKNTSNLVTIYVNGVAAGSTTNTNNKISTNSVVKIGGGQGSQNFTGYMDNVRITAKELLWTGNFNLTSEDLFYTDEVNPYIRPDNISGLYNVSNVKGNIRGRAKQGFVRPTIKQFFTSKDFEEIDSILDPEDDFSGTTINTDRWTVQGSPTQDGTLNINTTQGSYLGTYGVSSNFHFTGDFDVQIDFSNWSCVPSVNAGHAGFGAFDSRTSLDGNTNTLYLARSYHESRSMWFGGSNDNDVWGPITRTNTTVTESKFRLTRVGTLVTAYYWNGSSWTQEIQDSLPNMLKARIRIYGTNPLSAPNLKVDFDNFIVNSGDIAYE